jgi:cell division protease FtsH
MTVVSPYHGEMSNLPPPPPPPPPGRGRGQQKSHKDANSNKSPNQQPGKDFNPDGSSPKGPGTWPKWTIWAMIGVLAAVILVPSLWPTDNGESLEYSEWREQVIDGNIATAEINTGSG